MRNILNDTELYSRNGVDVSRCAWPEVVTGVLQSASTSCRL